MKKAFSLIELTIVIAITTVLLFIVTNYLITAIQNNNRVTIENEVRGEANSMIDMLAKDIRASRCECLSGSTLALYGVTGCVCPWVLPAPTPYAIYTVNGDLQLLRNAVPISSNRVWIRSCSNCVCTFEGPGFVITEPSTRTYTINLSLTQSRENPRSDFCGKVTLNQTVSPRNKN